VPATIASQFRCAQQLVGQGVAPRVAGAPPALQSAIDAGCRTSFMSGFQVAILLAAVVSIAGLFLGFFVHDRSDESDAEVDELAA